MVEYRSEGTIKARVWEGKPLSYAIKHFYANYPGSFLALVCFFGIAPLIITAQLYNQPYRPKTYLEKYKSSYTVIRDDDPKVEYIKEINEKGREFFPKY